MSPLGIPISHSHAARKRRVAGAVRHGGDGYPRSTGAFWDNRSPAIP